MRRCWRVRAAVAGLAWLGWLVSPAATVAAGPTDVTAPQDHTVLRAELRGPVTPVTADYLIDGAVEAEQGGHQAYLVEIDTPGGLSTSMREIIKTFLGSRVPVIAYVTPSGGRAASAGALITLSSHVAAMAPGTTIGAATPVNMESGEKASDKVVNDAAAYAESVAQQRGRNTDVAVDMVRSGTSLTSERALDADVVDLLARDRAALLAELDGRTVATAGGPVTLRTGDARVVDYDLGVSRWLLRWIADPNVAFLLMSIGTLAIIYEMANPGQVAPGIVGAILLILGLFALSVLPVNVAGLLLLLLAAGLFIAEVFAPGIGVFAVGGTVSLVLAGIFLFEGPREVSLGVLWPTALVVGGGSIIAGRLAWRARRAQPTTGKEGLIGRTAVVGDSGQVFVEGAWWAVRGEHQPLRAGQTVRVTRLDGLTLVAEPTEPTEPTEPAEPAEPAGRAEREEGGS